ncbi:MAG: ferrous iron transport protein B [Acidobacteriota bacterium]
MKKIDEKSRVILLGNPNVGKSVIFGALTGRYVTVSNYPGTTVEISKGGLLLKDRDLVILDTPGINSLVPMSEEERVTRDMLLTGGSSSVVQVADAKNLERGLFLSLQLSEMGVPFVLCLNMSDEAKSRGIDIDEKRLEEVVGVPIVRTVAVRGKGISRLKHHILIPRQSRLKIEYDRRIEEAIRRILPLIPDSSISGRSVALMLLCGDKSLVRWLEERGGKAALEAIEKEREELSRSYMESILYHVNMTRMRMATRISRQIKRAEERQDSRFRRLAESVSMHPFWGLLVLGFVLYLLYLFVGIFGASICVNFFEETLFGRFINPISVNLSDRYIPFRLLRDFLVGEYGVVTMALTYSIAIILPIVVTFFIAFGILEDSGYLPRLAAMINRIFRIMGLNGKAVLPMILGFGCDTMATLTTRILETKKEKTIVILLLALGVPCSAQLTVILAMLGALSWKAMFLWISVIISVIFIVGLLASKIIPGKSSDFILEIPPLRWPKISNLITKTLARMEWYLKEAVPLFILGTVILFVSDRLGILLVSEKVAAPIVSGFLGLPEKAAESFLIGFLRRDFGAAGLYRMAEEALLDPVQIVVSLVTITLFIPCIANFFMIIKEKGLKVAAIVAAFIFPFAILIGGLLNFVLRWLDVVLE